MGWYYFGVGWGSCLFEGLLGILFSFLGGVKISHSLLLFPCIMKVFLTAVCNDLKCA